MTINIKLPDAKPSLGSDWLPADGGLPVVSCGTLVFNDHGQEITDITKINIHIELDSIVTATVEVCVSCETDMDNIHALLGTDTLDDILKLHGLKGVPREITGLADREVKYARRRVTKANPSTKDPSEYD